MIEILSLCINDFFKKKFILLSILPFISSLLVIGLILIFGANELFDLLKQSLISTDFSFIDETKQGFLVSLLSFDITRILVMSIFYTLGGLLGILLSVIIAAIIVGFLTPIVTKFVDQKYYNTKLKSQVGSVKVIKISLAVFFKFILILLITIPFVFVPFLNLFIINVPFFYLFYKFMLIDVASNSLDELSFELMMRKDGGFEFKFVALIFYALSLIPFVGLFFQLFFVMFFTHLLLRKNQIYRNLQ